MTKTADELTIEYRDGDLVTVKQLDKAILTKGAWCTILYRYQNWDGRKQAYGADQYSIRRYQKRGDAYQLRSKFNISSKDQARKLIDILTTWTADEDDNSDS